MRLEVMDEELGRDNLLGMRSKKIRVEHRAEPVSNVRPHQEEEELGIEETERDRAEESKCPRETEMERERVARLTRHPGRHVNRKVTRAEGQCATNLPTSNLAAAHHAVRYAALLPHLSSEGLEACTLKADPGRKIGS